MINFEVNPHEDFRLGMPRPGIYEEVFNSDDEEFGGSGVTNKGVKFKTEDVGPLPKKRTRKTAAKSAKPAAKSATAGKAAAKKAPSRKTSAAKTGNTKVAGKSKAPSTSASKGGNAKARSTGATKSE